MARVEQQFAEKLHSYTLPRRQINTRAKDLIDLILILKSDNHVFENFKHSLQRVFRARNTHFLPETLPEPPVSWQKPFAEMAVECAISESLRESFTKVSEFYNALQRMNKSEQV